MRPNILQRGFVHSDAEAGGLGNVHVSIKLKFLMRQFMAQEVGHAVFENLHGARQLSRVEMPRW